MHLCPLATLQLHKQGLLRCGRACALLCCTVLLVLLVIAAVIAVVTSVQADIGTAGIAFLRLIDALSHQAVNAALRARCRQAG